MPGTAAQPKKSFKPPSPARIIGLGLMTLILVVVGFLLLSDVFFVYEVEATGLHAVSPERLLAASGVENYNIFYLRREDIAARVKALPEVKDATVEIRLPSRVIIHVQERAASVVWRRSGVEMWVDSDGVTLPVQGELTNAPVILDTTAGTLQQGQKVDGKAVAAALELSRLMPEARTFQYSPDTGISMVTEGGWPVVFGDSSDAEVKVFVYRQISRSLEVQGIQPKYVDVRVPTAPTYVK
jgi:cell division septal protein FtsQ